MFALDLLWMDGPKIHHAHNVATYDANLSLIKVLYQKGVQINALDFFEMTPLDHILYQVGHKDGIESVITYLTSHGAKSGMFCDLFRDR